MALNERDMRLVPGDRALVLGGSGCGKSTLVNRLMQFWQEDYCHPRIDRRQRGRLAVLDHKPRFRATQSLIGPSIRRRYKNFVTGDTVRGAILDDLRHWDLVWDADLNPWQTIVAQLPDGEDMDVVRLCVAAANRLYKTQGPKHPSMLYVDEGLSFFGPSGQPKGGDGIQRCFRAGREKGLVPVLASQRPRQINLQTLTESNVVYVFFLNSEDDERYLAKMGIRRPPFALDQDDVGLFWPYRNGRLMNDRPVMLPNIGAA